MSWVQRAADINGGQDGEYETLDEAHADFKAGEGNERNSRWFGMNKTECGLNTTLVAGGN